MCYACHDSIGGIMRVKNTSSRDEVVIQKIDGQRTVHTVGPGEVLELPSYEGLNLCKSGSTFIPDGKDAEREMESTIPIPEPVKMARKRTGMSTQAEKDISEGIKSGN